MYHIFFIHSSVNGYLACFHILAIVNSAARNTGVHISFQIMFFLRYMPRSEIAVPYASSPFSFLRNLHNFSILAVPIYIPINNAAERAMAPHSSTLAWKIPWMESLVGCSPWGCTESDMTEVT